MTSNIGGHLTGDFDRLKNQVVEELEKVSRPEFLDRFNEVIVIKWLGNLQMKEILNIMLKEVYERHKAKLIVLDVTDQ